MFEEQLELFNQPIDRKKESGSDLEGKFSSDFLSSMKSLLSEKLGLEEDLSLSELLLEFKRGGERLGAHDLIAAAGLYKRIAGISEDKSAQRRAEKFVAHEVARLARELDLSIFQPAYPKLKDAPIEPEAGLEEREKQAEGDDKNLKLFGRRGTYISHSIKEED